MSRRTTRAFTYTHKGHTLTAFVLADDAGNVLHIDNPAHLPGLLAAGHVYRTDTGYALTR